MAGSSGGSGAGASRTINKISVPVVSDVGGFSKGLEAARRDADKFTRETGRSFGLMSTSIRDNVSKVSDKLKDLGKTNVGTVTQGLAGMAAAAVASAAAIATIGFKHLGDLGKDALALGVSAEALSRLRGVARSTGTDFGDLSEFIKGLTESINGSIGKTTTASEAFKALGTSAEALQKMTPDEQIATLNKGFAALPNDAERARVAMQLAGQAGVKVFRMLALGTRDFKKAFDEAPVMTDDDVSEIRKLQIAIDKIGASVGHLVDLFTVKLAPAIESVASILEGVAAKFGVVVAKAAKPITLPKLGGPSAATSPTKAIEDQKAQADNRAEAVKAQTEAQKLQERYDKQAESLAKTRRSYVPNTNGTGYKLAPRIQRQVDAHSQTGQDLGAARARAQRLADESKSMTQAQADAIRMNAEVLRQFADLKQEYRATVEGSGKDEIHRRVDAIKGLTSDQRKQLYQQGYQAREAARTSSLRDELQESTKLPQQKLAEDLARINRMVALGAENGGLTKLQGIRAASQKTLESGLAGTEPRFAGALEANSMEGRSYLLSQLNRNDDPVAIAKQGLALTGQSNTYLGGILNAVTNRRRDMVAEIF